MANVEDVDATMSMPDAASAPVRRRRRRGRRDIAAHDAHGEDEAVAADAEGDEGDEALPKARDDRAAVPRSLPRGPLLAVIAPHERECYASTS